MSPSSWPPLFALAALLVPLLFGLAALAACRPAPADLLFRRAGRVAGAALVLALAVGVGVLLLPEAQRGAALPPGVGWRGLGVRLDAVTGVMLALVCVLGTVIIRYARTYLQGDARQAGSVRWLLATLAAVTLLVVSDHLLVIALAWTGTSLALHPLLTFYAERPQALIVAHKKFLVSRLADLCVLAALALLFREVGSLALRDVHAWAAAVPALPATVQGAALLLVLGAVLRSAQLPFHGWLIQVMEAPTPVSALLHAGVVNIAGFLMLRLAPLMVRAEPAQTLLVAVGCATAVVAALIMTTRVSIKVMLAWSTCAQMGFMLVQCGLGAYRLALLHLVAHSLYKAHAFLGAGSTVDVWRTHALVPAPARVGPGTWLAVAPVALGGVAAVGALYGVRPAQEPALWALSLVLGLGLTPLLARGGGGGARRLGAVALGSLAVAALSFTWHALFADLGGAALDGAAPSALRLGLVVAGFTLLFLLQAVLGARPDGALARWLYPRLFAGLWLDERFTRLTFRLWPATLPPRAPRLLPLSPALPKES